MTFDEWADGKSVLEMDSREVWEAATQAEREACADLCDRIFAKRDLHGKQEGADAAEFCATEIRKRSNVELTGGALAPSSDRRERG